ncbi:MAG: NAD(P)/FAD-dependent oxidoreductase [Muribaculaceae bacterium]|nr:NAD(P)/FAD-dependent oxidoreductase [Muribaculaceae bacterium]
MIEKVQIRVSPEERVDENIIRREVCRALGLKEEAVNDLQVLKESIDARKRDIVFNLSVAVACGDDKYAVPPMQPVDFSKIAADAPAVVIVGAGPAGLFAGLRAIERGFRPIILERGRDVDTRRVDIAMLNRTGEADEESNYCFGEGGAGTFSDGKLYTRSKKRGDNDSIMQLLVQFGADPKILRDGHPHIGSDRLPHIIKNIREKIRECGGEVSFGSRVDYLLLEEEEGVKHAVGVKLADGTEIKGVGVILATGHSARDTIRNLYSQGVKMEPKGFAMGVRLEHPSQLIDQLQYHTKEGRGEYLPAAEYNYVTQVAGRGVYSFCMCPGGVVVPAVSGRGESVVNGMSASGRSGRWSNSGMVVEIRPGDFPEYASEGVFELMRVQEECEKAFYRAADNTLKAPAQRMYDFVKGKLSASLPRSSYPPGIISRRVDQLLPPFIATRLQDGFKDFGRKSKGFLTNEACVIGLESRTSSPVRIPRDKQTLCHTEIDGLYPAGEGAGYAGGIVSAAIDGRRCMDAICNKQKKC